MTPVGELVRKVILSRAAVACLAKHADWLIVRACSSQGLLDRIQRRVGETKAALRAAARAQR